MTYVGKDRPTITILVITYNSSKFILSTLESARNQTYENLELIISDDCSTDDTVMICYEWLKESKNRFLNSKLLTSSVNTGISANINRGIKSMSGSWLKIIAGDDILLSNCISDNIKFTQLNPNASFVFSKGEKINSNDEIIGYVGFPKKQMQLEVKQQFREMLIAPFVFTPSSFIKASVFSKTGLFNEKSPMLEDYPMWIKATKVGFKMYFMDIFTIQYRIHNESVTANNSFNINAYTYSSNTNMLLSFLELYNEEYLLDLKKTGLYNQFILTKLKRSILKSSIKKEKIVFLFLYVLYRILNYVLNHYCPITNKR
jgi:glycosyltransferase involved in cell wall biosynthesis